MTKRQKSVVVFAVMGVLSAPSASHADPALYQPQAPASFSATNQPWTCNTGYKFTPNKNIFVTQLGGTFYGTKNVYLYSTNGTVLAQASVTGGGLSYAYTSITPVPLVANTTYSIGVWLAGSGGNDYIASAGLAPVGNGDITVNTGCYTCNGNGNPCAGTTTNLAIYGVPDFKYQLDTALYQPIAPASINGPFSGTYNMGYSFTPNKAVTVTSLGAYVNAPRSVALYTQSGTQLGSTVTVSCATTYPCWAYAALPTPQPLNAGVTYQVGVLTNSYYYAIDSPPITRNVDITINNGCWSSTTTQSKPCVQNSGGTIYGIADLEYSITLGSCGTIPASGSYILNSSLTAGGTSNCLYIDHLSNVSLDCRNYSIVGGTNASAVAIVNNSSGVTIKNCALDLSSGDHPLDIQGSSNSSVSTSILGAQTPNATLSGVNVNGGTSISIVSNTVAGEISVNFSTLTNIRQNTVSCRDHDHAGIGLAGGSHNNVSGNIILGNALCDDGILVGQINGLGSESNDTIWDNNISNVWDAGIETLGLIQNSHFDNNILSNNPDIGIGGWHAMSLDGTTFTGNTINQSMHAMSFGPSNYYVPYTAFYFRNNVFSYNTVTNPTWGGGDDIRGPGVVSGSAVNNAPVYEGNNLFTGNSWGTNYCPPNFRDYNSTLSANVTDGGNNVCFVGDLSSCANPIMGTEPIMCHTSPGCGGWQYNAGGGLGCWYNGAAGQSCNTVCSTHGGFNATTSTHTGNRAGTHFWPGKTYGSNAVSVECSSTDNNTNWGANGALPDGNFSIPPCMLSCSCNN